MMTWNCVPIRIGVFREGLLDRGLDLWWRPLGGGNGDFLATLSVIGREMARRRGN